MLKYDERQAREAAFHQDYARINHNKVDEPVADDILRSLSRRPWNAYWSTYDELMALDLSGKKLLLPGCGFGEDAIRLATLGAEVYANDLSEDILEIAKIRAERARFRNIHFDCMPSESLLYPDNMFDIVVFNDILHHVDIQRTLDATLRVVKQNGVIVINELYTFSAIQRIRDNKFVSNILYPRMNKFIYRSECPYITEDERKINEKELAIIENVLRPSYRIKFFLFFEGRVFPSRWPTLSRLDLAALKLLGRLGRVVAGRFVLVGNLR